MTASVSPDECRTARAALGWSQKDLAERSRVGVASVKKFEVGTGLHPVLVEQLRRTFEAAGIAFLEAGTMVGAHHVRMGVVLVER